MTRSRQRRTYKLLVSALSTAVVASAPLTTEAASAAATTQAATQAATASSAARVSVDRSIKDARVTESSGLARSTYSRDVLFTHNDSGDSARVFAVRPDGGTAAVLGLRGASARDFEDISSGPGHKLWMADIGDNSRSRRRIQIYRFTEPSTLRNSTVSATRFDFRYEDGRHDAEAIMVHPQTGRLMVVSKARSGAKFYMAPRDLSTTGVNVLRAVAPAPSTVTAASWAPGGIHIVAGTYTSAYIYRADRLSRAVLRLPLPRTRQGESLEFGSDPRHLLRGSEGSRSPVYRIAR